MATRIQRAVVAVALALLMATALAGAAWAATLVGNAGENYLVGTPDKDTISGLAEDDDIVGRGGADDLSGGRGEDKLEGRQGGDYIVGGRGVDDLYVYTIDPDGGGKTKVTEGSDPSFSADGKKIAYVASDGNDSEIYTIKATGGRPFQVTDNAKNDSDPSWSPNGEKIAYTHYSDSDLPNEAAAVYKIGAEGGSEVLVTDNNGTGALFPSWGSRP
jgi:TolB protein